MRIESLSPKTNSALIAQHSVLCAVLGALLFARCGFAAAQESKVYRIGVIHQGGPYRAVVDGFRAGLRELGLEDGKKISLQIRETASDPKIVDQAAKAFERDKVSLIYAVTTSAAVPVKNDTSQTPIVFAVGTDPVLSGLVQSFAKPAADLRVFSTRPPISPLNVSNFSKRFCRRFIGY